LVRVYSSQKDIVGRSIISEKFPSTLDTFWFTVRDDVVVNPFDFVSVDNSYGSITIGIVKDMQSVVLDNIAFSLSGDFKRKQNAYPSKKSHLGRTTDSSNNVSQVVTAARAAVIANATPKRGYKTHDKINLSVSMPLREGKTVRFATPDQVIFALGIPDMKNPIPAGVIEMSNRERIPISLDVTYIAGPDTTHVNVSGISGNKKTSYLLFLLQSAYQSILKKMKEDLAIIIFNTKEDDLLHIDEKPHKISGRQKDLFTILGLKLIPFENVTYFLPRGRDGMPNSAFSPPMKAERYKTYSYELRDMMIG
jgi:hypothetical protein